MRAHDLRPPGNDRVTKRAPRFVLPALLGLAVIAGCGGDGEPAEEAAATIPPEVEDSVKLAKVGPGVDLPPDEVEAAFHEEVTRLLGEELARRPGLPVAAALAGDPLLLASEPCCGVTSLSEANGGQALQIIQRASVAVTERFEDEVNPGEPCCTVTMDYGRNLQGRLDTEANFEEELDPAAEVIKCVSPTGEELDPAAVEAQAAAAEGEDDTGTTTEEETETTTTAPEGEAAPEAPEGEVEPEAPSEPAPVEPSAPEGETAP